MKILLQAVLHFGVVIRKKANFLLNRLMVNQGDDVTALARNYLQFDYLYFFHKLVVFIKLKQGPGNMAELKSIFQPICTIKQKSLVIFYQLKHKRLFVYSKASEKALVS